METRKEGPSLACCFVSQLSWAEMPSVTPRQPDCHIQQNICGLGTTSAEFSLCTESLAHPAESNSPLHVQVCLPGRLPQRKGLAGLDHPPSPLMTNANTDKMVGRALCPQEDHCLEGREPRALNCGKVPGGVQQCQISVMTLDLEVGGQAQEPPDSSPKSEWKEGKSCLLPGRLTCVCPDSGPSSPVLWVRNWLLAQQFRKQGRLELEHSRWPSASWVHPGLSCGKSPDSCY